MIKTYIRKTLLENAVVVRWLAKTHFEYLEQLQFITEIKQLPSQLPGPDLPGDAGPRCPCCALSRLRRLAPSAPIADAFAALPLRAWLASAMRAWWWAGLLFPSSLHTVLAVKGWPSGAVSA